MNWVTDKSPIPNSSTRPLESGLEHRSNGNAPVANKWIIAWCHHADVGGSKRAAFEMVRELSRRGHIIDEFIIRGSEPSLTHFPLEPFVRYSSHTIFRRRNVISRPYFLHMWASVAWSVWNTWRVRRTLRQLAGIINQGGYDIVHIDQYPFCPSVRLLPYLRVPTILYSHEPSNIRYQYSENGDSPEGRSLFRRWYTWFCELAGRLLTSVRNGQDIADTRHANVFLTNSHYSKETFFQRYGCIANVCHYGVDTDTFRPLYLSVECMVLSVGRLVRAKQHHVIVEAVGMIESSHRPRLIVTTPEDAKRLEDSSYAQWLMRLAQEKGVHLDIRMNPSQAELLRLYNQAIAIVFVPIMEPFGLVPLEAMACGTPAIGVREAGVRESVIDGVTGVLVERDISQIAAAIDYLQQHGDVRAKMCRHAVEYIQTQWTWERTIDRYEDEVRGVLSMSARQPRRPA